VARSAGVVGQALRRIKYAAIGIDAKFYSGKRKAVLMANPFCFVRLL
jgi:hypothetical protein